LHASRQTSTTKAHSQNFYIHQLVIGIYRQKMKEGASALVAIFTMKRSKFIKLIRANFF